MSPRVALAAACTLLAARILAFVMLGTYVGSVARGHREDVVLLLTWALVCLLVERVIIPVSLRHLRAWRARQ